MILFPKGVQDGNYDTIIYIFMGMEQLMVWQNVGVRFLTVNVGSYRLGRGGV